MGHLEKWLRSRFAPYMARRGSRMMVWRCGNPAFPASLRVERYFLIRTRYLGVYVHHYLNSDPDGLHDHPWWNISIPLVNGFAEERHDGTLGWLPPRSFLLRSARELHRIVLPDEKSSWSVFIRFNRIREWGSIREPSQMSHQSWRRDLSNKALCEDDFRGVFLPTYHTRKSRR